MLTQVLNLAASPAAGVFSGIRRGVRLPVGALMCGVALTALLASSGEADASLVRKFSAKRADEVKKEQPALKGPLIIDVSIGHQRLTLFDAGVPVARAPVSTGMNGHPTPTGVFSVIQKQKWHQSNIYSGAPMPFMQRITWSGVALHAGVLPGYPASHGCIRMPHEFAVRLYGMTKLGVRVFVTHNEITPIPISSPRLFTPKPAEAAAADPDTSVGGRVTAARPSDGAMPTTDTPVVTATLVSATSSVATPAQSKPDSTREKAASADKADSAEAKPLNPGPGDQTSSQAPSEAKPDATKSDAAKTDNAKPAAKVTVPDRTIPDRTIPDRTLPDGTLPNGTMVADQGQRADVLTATDVTNPDAWDSDAGKTDGPDIPLPQARPSSAQLKSGPLSIFISKKLGRLFVRRGFDPLFDVAVTIAEPERPLGTHVFTATDFNDDRSAMRWLLVSMPPEPTKRDRVLADERATGKMSRRKQEEQTEVFTAEAAAAALERIDVPVDVRDRIGELLVPGASLIISDKDLGPETGMESDTDFIVLTR